MIRKCINQELRCGIKSKIYYITIFFLIALFGIVIYMNYNAAIDSHEAYLKYENYYKSNHLDLETALKGEYKVEKHEGGQRIENPILYYKESVGKYIYSASPKYLISEFLESATLFFPLVFGLLGLFVSTYDIRHKTLKNKTVRSSRSVLGAAKHLTLLLSSFVILVIALIISFLIGLIVYKNLSNSLPVADFISKTEYTSSSSILIKIAFGYIVALLFAEIGYALGILFKNMIVGIVAIAIYIYVMPILGSFDLRTSMKFLAKKVFDFYGVVSIETPSSTSIIKSVSVIFIAFMISGTTSMIITAKRSSFDC